MKWVCPRARSTTTDAGAERFIVDMPCVLAELFAPVGRRYLGPWALAAFGLSKLVCQCYVWQALLGSGGRKDVERPHWLCFSLRVGSCLQRLPYMKHSSLRFLGSEVPAAVLRATGARTNRVRGLLFPGALAVPGWLLLWDLMTRNGLCSATWFPMWLEGLQSIVSVLRHSAHVAASLARHLRRQQLGGAAAVIGRAKLPDFAEWRRGHCSRVVATCLAFSRPFAEVSTAEVLSDSRDSVGIVKVRIRYHFGRWYCDWMGGIMRLGHGCICHEQELLVGKAVDCDKKGRRLPQAYSFATEALRRGLEEANSWAPEDQGGDLGAPTQFEACVRGADKLPMRKVGFLDRLPYLLARLGELHVRSRCGDSVAERPHAVAHRQLRMHLQPGGQGWHRACGWARIFRMPVPCLRALRELQRPLPHLREFAAPGLRPGAVEGIRTSWRPKSSRTICTASHLCTRAPIQAASC